MKYLKFIFIFSILLSVSACKDPLAHKNQKENKDIGTKVSKYICPMHPQITSDKPGSCSICGMDLVPSEIDEDESEETNQHEHTHETNTELPDSGNTGNSKLASPTGRATVKMSLDKQQLIGVKFSKVNKMKLFKTVRAPGRIAFDPELYTAQSEYIEALRQWQRIKNSPLKEVKRSTNQMIKSSKIRLKVLGLNSEQINKIARKGIVSESLIIGGKKGDNLIYADVFESDLSDIKPGQLVVIEGSFLGGQKLNGKVVSVDQVINPKTRSGKVRISIEKTKASIRPEAFVKVSIAVPLGEHLSISLESVLDTGRDLFVFVKQGQKKFEPRKVLKLFETDDYMAISSGLSAGEEVVTAANFLLDSESRLKSVIKNASETQGHNH